MPGFFGDIYPMGWLALVVVAAYIMDLFAGDPEWMPHPVRCIGRYISFLERALRPLISGKRSARFLGAVMAVTVVLTVWIFSACLLYVAYFISPVALILISIYLVWSALSQRSLQDEALAVMGALNSGGAVEASEKLARIVGRDTAELTEDGIARAVVETVSENTSDGIVAPLFFLAIGGPPTALAYKAVNTLDSMVGYRNERYLDFGSFSARLDDAANFIPARITALLMVASSVVLGFDWRAALRTVRADASSHPSPNAGFPEAAVAGAVGIRLGGAAYYSGELCEKPEIGSGPETVTPSAVNSAISIMHLTGGAMAVIVALVVLAF